VAGAALAAAALLNLPPWLLEFLLCLPWARLADLYRASAGPGAPAAKLAVGDAERRRLANARLAEPALGALVGFLLRPEVAGSLPPLARPPAGAPGGAAAALGALLDGATPLHCAAMRGNPAQARLCVPLGAPPARSRRVARTQQPRARAGGPPALLRRGRGRGHGRGRDRGGAGPAVRRPRRRGRARVPLHERRGRAGARGSQSAAAAPASLLWQPDPGRAARRCGSAGRGWRARWSRSARASRWARGCWPGRACCCSAWRAWRAWPAARRRCSARPSSATPPRAPTRAAPPRATARWRAHLSPMTICAGPWCSRQLSRPTRAQALVREMRAAASAGRAHLDEARRLAAGSLAASRTCGRDDAGCARRPRAVPLALLAPCRP